MIPGEETEIPHTGRYCLVRGWCGEGSEIPSYFITSPLLGEVEEELLTGKGHEEAFWGDENILFVNLITSYVGVAV